MTAELTNWAGTLTFTAQRVHRPRSVDELRRVVAASPALRVLGGGHSFNRLADSPADLVMLDELPRRVEVDVQQSAVTVTGHLRYGDIVDELDAHGVAVHNLASLPHISVAGAVQTATHGSGARNGNLATAVRGLELVTSGGDLVTLTREGNGERFLGAVVGLGALGVVTRVTLDVEPAFEVAQHVYDDLPLDELYAAADEILTSAYSVSLFTRWTGPAIEPIWVKQRTDATDRWTPPPSWHGATLADSPRHPIAGMPTRNCTEQLGVPGPSYARLPHFRMEFTPSSGEEIQSEFFVAREHLVDAVRAIDAIRDVVAPVLQVSEVRTIAADRLWLSPQYEQDTAALHFTWVKDAAAAERAAAAVEAALAPYEPRPHWGKVFTMAPDVVRGRYPRFDDFRALAGELDPRGAFCNPFLEPYLR
jgi:xylitol oxidase